MRVLVTGSRNWHDRAAIEKELRLFKGECVLVHGGAQGADKIAKEIAIELGWEIEEYKADWSKGLGAGPIRNKQMVDSSPDICLAFVINYSRGATHCAKYAESKNIDTKYIRAYN